MRQLIAGNWKMNGSLAGALALAMDIAEAAGQVPCDLLICPPATLIEPVVSELAGAPVAVGGQDCHAAAGGAHTGDISAAMLRDAGAGWVILGHSERRSDHAETDVQVRAKVAAAVAAGLVPVVCVGETEAERLAGRAEAVVARSWRACCRRSSPGVVAYEPVWAIGTGRTPTEADVAAMHAFIRAVLRRPSGRGGAGHAHPGRWLGEAVQRGGAAGAAGGGRRAGRRREPGGGGFPGDRPGLAAAVGRGPAAVPELAAYFARIGYAGPRTPTLATLRAIHALHPAAIPFENIDPLLGRPVRLDLAALQAKLLRGRRGGYCFEHNTLFRAMLERLGFAVTGLMARVLWRAPPDRPPGPRTHMALLVEAEGGRWLADVGFGGLLADAPLRLAADIEQPGGWGTRRLLQAGEAITVQVRLAGAWQDIYRFTLEPQEAIDFEVANWFTSTHPKSRFRSGLMIERLMPQVRLGLFNRRLTRRHPDGRVEEAVLGAPEALARVLAAEFGIAAEDDAARLFALLAPP